MKYISILLVFSLSLSLNAQRGDEKLDFAVNLYGAGKKQQAHELLKVVLTKQPNYTRALFVKGRWMLIEGRFSEAEKTLTRLEQVDPAFNPLTELMLAEAYMGQKKWSEADKSLDDFLGLDISNQNRKLALKMKKDIEFVKNYKSDDFNIEYTLLGSGINTNDMEYFPSLTADGSRMYFTRKSREDENIWVSDYINGTWSTARPIDKPEFIGADKYISINSHANDGAHTIAPSGKFLFFTSCERPHNVGSCDMYYAMLTGNKWGKPKILIPPVNEKGWDSQPCITSDGKKLYFTSSRPGGKGGTDIYYTTITPKGLFTEPVNLGDVINTPGNEQRPFIHPDGKTLYFSSEGHPGFGNYDLFVSKFENGKWQTPVNMGDKVNSDGSEMSIFINTEGNKAYVARQNSDKPIYDVDIYSFDLPEKFRPEKTLFIKGIVSDKSTNKPLRAKVVLFDIEKGEKIMTMSSDRVNGGFLMTLVQGKEYGFQVKKEGYSFYSENFSFTTNKNEESKAIEIKLSPLVSGVKFALRNVFFETGKYELKSSSKYELDNVYETLKSNPNLRIQIAGHTDNVGSDADNQILSENRAKAVMEYLIQKGIAAERLKHKGYGASMPIESNDTEEGRAKNRRTEIEVL